MKTIVICGDCGTRELTETIIRGCSKQGGALVLDGTSLYETCSSPAFCVMSVNSLSELHCSGLLVLGRALCQVRPDLRLGNMLSVTESDNENALSLLRQSGSPVIGCSMSGCDTLTLSCLDENGALVSLQRSVCTLGGTLIEPCEIKLRLSKETALFPLLAACAVLLLSDIPCEKGYSL